MTRRYSTISTWYDAREALGAHYAMLGSRS
jgi:hypothetical protein